MKAIQRLLPVLLGALALTGLARLVAAQDDAGNDAAGREPAAEEREPDRRTPAGGEDDDVFIPTEEIPADEEITFPVNI